MSTGEFNIPDSVFCGIYFSRLLPDFLEPDGSRHGCWNNRNSYSSFLLLYRLEKQTEMDNVNK